MIDMRVTRMFFDKPKVLRAVNRAKYRALSKAGGWIRKTARFSMRRRKTSASPGRPPSAHVGLLRDFLFYAYDPSSRSVVIGPAAMKRRRDDVPALMEWGGTRHVRRGELYKRRGSKKWARATKSTNLKYAPHPFMGPALRKADQAGVLPEAWRNSVKARS